MSKYQLTETQLKLQDAATQMKLALSSSDDIEVVRSCVNSFISHARSVTFVLQRESSGYPRLEKWYERKQVEIKKNPLLRFFNDRRVYSIHKGVVIPRAHSSPAYSVKINGVELPSSGTMTALRFEGVDKFIPGDSGNVFRLCEEYSCRSPIFFSVRKNPPPAACMLPVTGPARPGCSAAPQTGALSDVPCRARLAP